MKLDQALELLDGKDLDRALSFWHLDRHAWPVGERERRRILGESLTTRETVEERLPQLPSKLRDLLVHVVRSGRWSEVFDPRDFEDEELSMQEFELVPVATALAERGLLFPRRVRGSATRGAAFCIPDELGHLLETVLDSSRRPVDAALGLRAHLRFIDRGIIKQRLEALGMEEESRASSSELFDLLIEPRSIRRRVEQLEHPELRAIFEDLESHGGILDSDARRRLGIEEGLEVIEAWGRELERCLLGSFERSELTNHGLNCGEGWLAIFGEITDVLLGDPKVDEDEAGGQLRRGADAVADMRNIVAAIEREPFKVKKTGEYYRTGVRRLVREALTPGERQAGAENDVLWHLEYLIFRDLVTPSIENRLRTTKHWASFRSQGGEEMMKDLLDYTMKSGTRGMSSLHHRGLRRGFIDLLKEQGVGTWIAIAPTAIRARNMWLLEMVRPEQAQRYQDRHKNAPFPRLASPDGMLRFLQTWVVESLTRIGVVDPAVRKGEKRPWALRMSRAGGRALGVQIHEQAVPSGLAMVINPDHEIIVFPENAGPDVTHELGRFATREKADFALHYRLTRDSVQDAASTGLTTDDILGFLDEQSRHGIPDNVAFSIREWCEKLVRAESRRAWLLEMASEEDLERVLQVSEVAELVIRRISDRIVELEADPVEAGLGNLLRERGIQLG